MALADPYSPCPCGSDKKLKWCCLKAEPFIERSQRLLESGQFEAAVSALDEGLAKFPDNAWSLLRKTLLLEKMNRLDEATETVARLVRHDPGHLGGAVTRIHLALMSEGAKGAVIHLQHALLNFSEESRPRLAGMATIVGKQLSSDGFFPAALKQLELALKLDPAKPEDDDEAEVNLKSLRGDPSVSYWLKEPFELSPPPAGMAAAQIDSFNMALSWASQGLWASAASAFELLSADPKAGATADRNLGLCRLWLGEDEAAIAPLRRWIDQVEPTTEAVDLAALCQIIDETPDPEAVEHVRLTWPIRDREALLKTLTANQGIVQDHSRPLDQGKDDSPEVLCFHYLDRSRVEPRSGLSSTDIPRVMGDILVGADTVMFETYDDGRLNNLVDQFTALVGTSVPPAHPRTKVIDRIDRSELAMSWHWFLPPELDDGEKKRLERQQSARIMEEIWPDTPLVSLGGRTPSQLARSGKSEAQLRAAVMLLESSADEVSAKIDWTRFRDRLNVPQEPAIDPATVLIDEVPVGRLGRIEVAKLDDNRLAQLFHRAKEFARVDLLPGLSREIIRRDGMLGTRLLDALSVYGNLVHEAIRKPDREAAMDAIRRGRAATPPRDRAAQACHWDMLEVQTLTYFDSPERWVPELVAVMDRYHSDDQATRMITTLLIQMGLIRLVHSPNRPGEVGLDSRLFERLLKLYGPKVTTADGYLGVSATKSEIWTPASENKGGAIWTPGSDAGPADGGDKPRIILSR